MAVLTSSDQWRVDGRSLMDRATSIEALENRDNLAPRRYQQQEIAYRHGEVANYDRFFSSKTIALRMWVAAHDADGLVSHSEGPEGHVRENLNELYQIFGKKGSAITLQRDVPDYPGAGTITLEANAQVVNVIQSLGRYQRGLLRRLTVNLLLPHPFWHELPVNTSAAFGGGNIATGGNAVINDMVITFKAGDVDPRLTATVSGDYLEISGTVPAGDVEVDVGARTVTKLSDGSAYDANLVKNRAWWMEWPPDTASLALTMTATDTVDLSWYDQWH